LIGSLFHCAAGGIAMPIVTIVVGAVLTAIGLFGYFGSASESPSVTALIPAFLGGALIVCGLVAHKPNLRMHAMHVAVLLALLGAIAALVRAVPKFGLLASDDPTFRRPVAMMFLMAITCIIYVVLCVRSFISARRRRTQATGQ
jgi:hypothetical protein